jgi:hypothetical protein
MRQCSVDRRCAAVNARNRLTSATWARMARGLRLRSAKCRCQVTNSVTARFVGRRTVTFGAYSKSSHSNMIRHCDKLPTARWWREAGHSARGRWCEFLH